MGIAMAAWLGSYYVFSPTGAAGQLSDPEKAAQDRAAETFSTHRRARRANFFQPKQTANAIERCRLPAELAKTNAELARNYIRNYQQVAGLVPYVVGRYTIMEAHASLGLTIYSLPAWSR